ncbi:MAG TPA: hypothetical protein VK815_12150 [Candidatus Acidoferrales bacterium]|jgi:hypothetical protein|nr:hypothetical protein [Candidatus Acidoferrales bacterium]
MATGKISRLPREIREQVNERLAAGEPGKRLVAWLNELPAVRAMLAAEFDGAAINEQNLTNWKQGGFRDWRMDQEVAAFNQAAVGAKVPVVTTEQLSTVLAIRYLTVVREWQQSPMPSERRWRKLRVILRDVLKLQQGEHCEQRLELGGKRLEFDRERLELQREQLAERKETADRRALLGVLVASRKWPEVTEAFAWAFRLYKERKEARTEEKKSELGPIKVNQGGKIFHEEEQTKLASCPSASRRGPSRTGRCPASELAGQRPALPVMVARMDENLAQLKPIKVDQGDIFSGARVCDPQEPPNEQGAAIQSKSRPPCERSCGSQTRAPGAGFLGTTGHFSRTRTIRPYKASAFVARARAPCLVARQPEQVVVKGYDCKFF